MSDQTLAQPKLCGTSSSEHSGSVMVRFEGEIGAALIAFARLHQISVQTAAREAVRAYVGGSR